MDQRRTWSIKKANVKYVNEDFFKIWSSEMAYILGFFAADGNLAINSKRGNKYLEFTSTDLEIIEKIKSTLKSEHKIGIRIRDNKNWKTSYRLQIGSKEMFRDLINLGFMPNKSKILQFPNIPKEFSSDFIRGYFDGDGHCLFCSFKRKNRPSMGKVLTAGFTSGSKEFLRGLKDVLERRAILKGGTLCYNDGYRLTYSTRNCIKLFDYLYQDKKSLFLERKFQKFSKAIKLMGS